MQDTDGTENSGDRKRRTLLAFQEGLGTLRVMVDDGDFELLSYLLSVVELECQEQLEELGSQNLPSVA